MICGRCCRYVSAQDPMGPHEFTKKEARRLVFLGRLATKGILEADGELDGVIATLPGVTV